MDLHSYLSDDDDSIDHAIDEQSAIAENPLDADTIEETTDKPTRKEIHRKIHVMTFENEEDCDQYMRQLARDAGKSATT